MKKLFVCIAVLIYCNAFSQGYNNVWVFGDSALLDFNFGYPEPGQSSIMTWEACASISDSTGNLLFYTNGEKVWNREHQVMLNGDGLNIGKLSLSGYGSSITQGVIILPKPGNNNLFYIFQIQNDGAANYGIEYSVVDISMDFSLGMIIEKNNELFEYDIAEKMNAVRHANGRDWWLITREWEEIGEDDYKLIFTKFLISPSGISEPYFQEYGPLYINGIDAVMGQMIFSPIGSKMIYTRGIHLDIYDFDRCSGLFSNLYTINNINNVILYGCSFSPDGSKVYVSGSCDKELFQYCLSCDGEPIDSTKKLIYDGPTGQYCLAQHQIGPDGKIYIATVYNVIPNDVFNSKNQNLCVINEPNEIYPLCDFDSNTISLGTRRVIGGLPNMPNYNLGALVGSECDTLGTSVGNLIEKSKINIYPNPASDELYLNCENEIELNYSLKTIIGSEIRSGKFIGKKTIDLSDIASGVYIIEISDNLGTIKYSEKIVKQAERR